MTAYPDSELINRALELGPISVLKKPVNRKQLVDLLSILSAPPLNSGRGKKQSAAAD